MDRCKLFKCDVKSIINNIKDAIGSRRIIGVRSLFRMAIDATKVTKCAQINNEFKCIEGATWEHHMIPTETLRKKDINAILNQYSTPTFPAEMVT